MADVGTGVWNGAGTTETLSGSQQSFTLGAYALINNDWGAQQIGLKIGTDYTETITFDPTDIQSNVSMAWTYPNYFPSSGAWAYPEISWGNKLGGIGPMTYSTVLWNLKGLVESYNLAIGGQTGDFDVGTEIWVTDKPWNQGGHALFEIMVKVHTVGGNGLQDGSGAAYDNPSSGVAPAIEAVHTNWGGGGGTPAWTFVTIDETSDNLSGTIDFAAILRQLVAQGIVSANDYVSGVEMGAEPETGGQGSLTLNSFSVTETLAADSMGAFNATDFSGTDASDLLISSTNGAVVIGSLGTNGQATWTQVGALGPEWSFKGSGDLTGDGKADVLIESTKGAVVLGELGANGQLAWTQIAELGPEWSFAGTGDFEAKGQAEFLIENTSGGVVLGSVSGGRASFVQVGALGPEWRFLGAGDYLGDGASDFLVESTSGAVVVGEIVNGKAQYTQVAALGGEWRFEGSGDFLGDGKSQFLIENTAGALVLGEVSGGKASFTQIGALGPEWKFVGVGAYAGAGADAFLIENANGAVVVGTMASGSAHYAQAAALGPEWTFRG